ncbi:MAG: hypothetical protein PGN21_07735 [Sphingomonas paucimobilis]
MSYFVRRAEQQLELAQQADHEQVVSAHYELANLYLDRAYAPAVPTEGAAQAA